MFRGRLDVVTRNRIAGWAQDPQRPGQPVALLITDNGVLLDRIVANRHRPDLAATGIGDGRHGFDIVFPTGLPGLQRHIIRVMRERDGVDLTASPALIERATAFDGDAQAALAGMLDGIEGEAAIDAALAALATQIDRLALRRRTTGVKFTGSRQRRGRALVIDSTMPAPNRDAGSNAILSHVEALGRLGYAVTFIAADPTAGAPPPTPSRPSATAFPVDWIRAPGIRTVEELLRREAGGFELVYLHRLDVAACYLPLVRFHQPRARVIYSVADLHHLRLARRGFVEREPRFVAQARNVRATELAVAGAADAVLTHSHAEADILRRSLSPDRVIVAPWSVPLMARGQPGRRGKTVGFIGHFGHAPNIDAARRLAFSIMPILRTLDPSITCRIAGTSMPRAMRDWVAPGVEMVGAVDDLGGFLAGLRLSVAPMAYGAGIKGKVLDSLAAGTPCVATPMAIEGLNWPAALAGCVATDDHGLAMATLRLVNDRNFHRRAIAAGRRLLVRDWSDVAVDAALHRAVGMPDAMRTAV